MTRIEQVRKFTNVIFPNGFIQVVNTSRLHRGKSIAKNYIHRPKIGKVTEAHKYRGLILKKFLLIGGVLLILFIYFGLNYSGFCFAEKRYLSNEEKIRAVFNYQNSRDTLPIDNFSGTWYPKHIKYKSFDEYITLYPDCCSVNPGGGYEVPPAKFLDRIFGYNSGDVVVINFKVRYLDENGSLKTGEKRFDNYLQNCGKPR